MSLTYYDIYIVSLSANLPWEVCTVSATIKLQMNKDILGADIFLSLTLVFQFLNI